MPNIYLSDPKYLFDRNIKLFLAFKNVSQNTKTVMEACWKSMENDVAFFSGLIAALHWKSIETEIDETPGCAMLVRKRNEKRVSGNWWKSRNGFEELLEFEIENKYDTTTIPAASIESVKVEGKTEEQKHIAIFSHILEWFSTQLF